MSVFDLFSNNAQLQAASTIGQGIQQGQAQALPYYNAGIGSLQQYYGNAQQAIRPTYAAGQQGLTAYGNATGVNGPAGSQKAYNAFWDSPGTQTSLAAANAGVAGQQAASGGTGSGSAILAGQRAAQNTAGQGWQNYVTSLNPYLNLANSSTGQLANVNTGLGGALNSAQQNVGNMYYGGATSAANALAAAQANTSGAANLLNLGLTGVAGLGGSLLNWSDIKLKEDIEPVGALASGETIYRGRYKGDPKTQLFLIAQEVEGSTPEAVVEVLPDLRAVDYRRATERAAKILEFSREGYESPPTHRPFASELLDMAA